LSESQFVFFNRLGVVLIVIMLHALVEMAVYRGGNIGATKKKVLPLVC
jgi:hypothetical protein